MNKSRKIPMERVITEEKEKYIYEEKKENAMCRCIDRSPGQKVRAGSRRKTPEIDGTWKQYSGNLIQFRPEQAGTWQNRQPDTVTRFLRRIPDIFRRVPTGNSAFPAGFSRKIHGILRQESSSWVIDKL
jgi:hypothetical protein